MITIHLSKRSSEIKFADDFYPENGKSVKEIKKYIKNLRKQKDFHIVTDSLYFIRELALSDIPNVFWYNHDTGKQSDCVDSIGEIAILDRDLEQSERYINKFCVTKISKES